MASLLRSTNLETGVNGADVSTLDPGSPDSFNAITATAPKYTNARSHSSSLSLFWSAQANVQHVDWTGLGGGTSDSWYRFYLNLPSLPSDNNYYPFQVRTAADSASAILRILSTGIIQMRDSTNSQIGSDGSIAVATNQWIRLEVRVRSSTTVGQMEWWLYNTTDAGIGSHTDTQSVSGVTLGANSDRVNFGTNVAAPAAGITHYFDDLAVSLNQQIGPAVRQDFHILGAGAC
jgi:hypothetical protein